MKKTSKPIKTPAPASKSKRSKSSTPTAKAASPIRASPAPIAKAAAPAPVAAPATIKIRATVDVGFGNALFVRGEGAGLSWDKGVPLQCIAAEEWCLELPATSDPVVFKFLLNDESWCVGEDYSVAAGTEMTFAPVF